MLSSTVIADQPGAFPTGSLESEFVTEAVWAPPQCGDHFWLQVFPSGSAAACSTPPVIQVPVGKADSCRESFSDGNL